MKQGPYINITLVLFFLFRLEWYTSGKKESNNEYIWEGDGLVIRDIRPEINFWMTGYQYVPEDRIIYKYDYSCKYNKFILVQFHQERSLIINKI